MSNNITVQEERELVQVSVSESTEEIQVRISPQLVVPGASDGVVTNVQLVGNSLNFTGIDGGFNGNIDLSGISVNPDDRIQVAGVDIFATEATPALPLLRLQDSGSQDVFNVDYLGNVAQQGNLVLEGSADIKSVLTLGRDDQPTSTSPVMKWEQGVDLDSSLTQAMFTYSVPSNMRWFIGRTPGGGTGAIYEIDFSGVSNFPGGMTNMPDITIRSSTGDPGRITFVGGPTISGGIGEPILHNTFWGSEFGYSATQRAKIGLSNTDHRSYFNFEVGFGTQDPLEAVDVVGNVAIDGNLQLANFTDKITIGGEDAFIYDEGTIRIGHRAGENQTTNKASIYMGELAGYLNTGLRNIVIGQQAAGTSLTTGAFNAIVGYAAGNGGPSLLVSQNAVFGISAMSSIAKTTSSASVFGYLANRYGGTNSVFGSSALSGDLSLEGSGNAVFGSNSLNAITQGANNAVFGEQSGRNLTRADQVVFMGYIAGRNYGGSNIDRATDIERSVLIGYNASPLNITSVNEIAVGHSVVGNGDNTATWGNTSITDHFFSGDLNLTAGQLNIGATTTTNTMLVIRPDAPDRGITVEESDSSFRAVRINGNATGGYIKVYGANVERINLEGLSGRIETLGPISPGGSTVASLPGSGNQAGEIRHVTDAAAITYRAVATGGGSDTALVMWDGTNWIYH